MSAGFVGTILRVVDGDTFIVEVDLMPLLGIEGLVRHHIRLLGVDAPEIKTEEGKAAALWLTDFAQGKQCLVELAHPDKFGGRVDCNVWLAGDPVSLSDQIIMTNHGHPYHGGKR